MCDLDFINTISSTFSSEINKFIQSFTLTIKQQQKLHKNNTNNA